MPTPLLLPARVVGRLLAGLLLLLSFGARAQAPANDDPCGAITLSPNGTLCISPTLGTNVGATTTTPNGYTNPGVPYSFNSCGAATQPKDVWFKFTTSASGPASFGVAITVTGNPAGSVRLFSAASCSGPLTLVECSASTASNTVAPRLTTGSLIANTTYYVAVAGYNSTDTQGQFTICLTDGPGAPTCGTPRIGAFTPTSPTTGTLAFTPGVNNTPPFVFDIRDNTAQRSLPTITTTTSPITLTGLVPGHSYSVTVAVACNTGGQALGGTSFTLPVPNDDPCGAIAVPVGATCTLVDGNNANATNSNISAGMNCALFGGRYDVWYTFTTAASGVGSQGVIVQNGANVTGSSAAGTFRVYSASSCNGPFTQIGCSTNMISGGGPAQPLTLNGLTPNTTYYLRIDEGGYFQYGNPGDFRFCVLGTSNCAPPTQLYAGTVTSNTIPLYWTAGNGNQSYTITYSAPGIASQTVTATSSPFTLVNLVPGTPYTISIVGNCSGGAQSTAATLTASTLISNDEPCGAVPLALSGATCTTPTAGTVTGATATTPNGYPASGCGISNTADVWYRFTTAASGPASTGATLTVGGGTGKQIRVFSASSCNGPFTQIGCSYAAGATPPLVLTSLTPSTTYYVSINGQGSSPNFSVCVSDRPACDNPTNFAAGSLTSTSANLTFTPAAGASSYVVTYTPQNGSTTTVTPAPTASPVNLTGLQPGTTYTATIQTVCAAGLGTVLSLTFTTPTVLPPGPANDDCSGATPITSIGVGTCGTALTSTTVSATSSTGAPDPGCASYQGRDVWFSLVVPSNGIVQVETGAVSGSSLTDTGLALYSGSCGSLALLDCDDDAGTGNFSLLRRTGLTPGSTIYARVWPYGTTSTSGQFTICAQTDAACPPATNLVVSNVANTTATLGFTASSAGTSYTVTYTPAGGSPVTLTPAPTGGPVQLTGLQPFTSYSVTVAANCAGGLTSTPVTTSFVTTPYCVTGLGGSCGGSNVTNVTIVGTTLANAGTTCTSVGGQAYTSYPGTGSTTATLIAGQTYQLQVTGEGNADVSAWIDYNQNGQFEASEWTQVVAGSLPNLPATVSITVPATALPGRTGLRIRSRAAGVQNGATDACTNFGSGETEDYLVTISLTTATHAGALAAQVEVYPNPAQQSFRLSLPAQLSRGGVEATLINALGQSVQQHRFAPAAAGLKTQVEVGHLPRGVYTLHLTTAAGPVTKRVVVE